MVQVQGQLDAGITISAELPRHLAGKNHPTMQYMVLTPAQIAELLEQLKELR